MANSIQEARKKIEEKNGGGVGWLTEDFWEPRWNKERFVKVSRKNKGQSKGSKKEAIEEFWQFVYSFIHW